MNKLYCILLSLSAWITSMGQVNLVPNGNFESNIVCSETATTTSIAIKNWFIPQNEVIDPEKPCTHADWWRFLKYRKIGLNNSYSGFIETYYRGFPDDIIYSGRRYLAIKLTQPLTAGQQYYFEMFTKAVDTFPNGQLVNTVFTNGQDVAFSKNFPTFDFDIPRNFMELRPTFRGSLFKDYDWHKVNGCFTADGGEKYMIIGNFRNDAGTDNVTTGKKNSNFPNGLTAYYVIDNVILTPMELNLRDTAICIGDTLQLNVLKTIPDSVTYKWHSGETTPQYQTTQTGNIHIDIQYSKECVIGKSFKNLVLTPDYQPQVQDTLVCEGTPMFFKAGVGLKGETIKWQNGFTEPIFKANTEGVFTAHVENRCARWVDSFRLQTRDCGNGVYIPNAFSPNGDGVNDTFKPFLKSDFYPIETYQFSVFNRWGNLIFQTTNKDDAWDGTYQGKTSAYNDTYIWSLTIRYNDKNKVKTLQLGGDIAVMRY